MKVELIDYQPNALDLLLYTKDTRLAGARSLADVESMPMEDKLEHLAYMRDTIQSSWEFVKYTFKIEGVTRNFTHQLVRTRTQAYAQESGRAVDQRHAEYFVPDFSDRDQLNDYINAMECIRDWYGTMIDKGMEIQNARNILPSSINTSIIVGTDLRTMHNTALVRMCYRTQGEYQSVFKKMRSAIIHVHPWADDFINVACADSGICIFPRYNECPIQHLTYNGHDPSGHSKRVSLIKQEHEQIVHEANPVGTRNKQYEDK